jgi:hypothetical protein
MILGPRETLGTDVLLSMIQTKLYIELIVDAEANIGNKVLLFG